MQTIFRWTLDI